MTEIINCNQNIAWQQGTLQYALAYLKGARRIYDSGSALCIMRSGDPTFYLRLAFENQIIMYEEWEGMYLRTDTTLTTTDLLAGDWICTACPG